MQLACAIHSSKLLVQPLGYWPIFFTAVVKTVGFIQATLWPIDLSVLATDTNLVKPSP
jgi:hypothetical protein